MRRNLDELMVRGPLRGYSQETTKSVLVVFTQNVQQVEAIFRGYRLKIGTGSRYLGGFVGTESEKTQWLGGNI